MKTVTVSFYNKATGEFTGQRYRGPESGLNVPDGLAYVEGEYEPALCRVQNGLVIGFEPPQGFVWHAPTGTLIEQSKFEAAKRDAEARAEIDRLERSQHRAVREAALGDAEAKERVRAIDARIAAIRKDLR